MRNVGSFVLGVLWILLLLAYLAYTAPRWMPGYVSWDFAVSVRGPGPDWLPAALIIFVLLLPPLVLGFITWMWFTR